MNDILQISFRELSRRKTRTALNVLGYFLAVAILVIMITLFNISSAAQTIVLSNIGNHFIAFAPFGDHNTIQSCSACISPTANRNSQEGFIANSAFTNILPQSLLTQVQGLKEVKDTAACLWYRFSDDKTGELFTVSGIDTNNKVAVATTCCAPKDIQSGRFLEPQEKGSLMVEERYAKNNKINLGDTVQIAGKDFSVVGIVNSGIRPVKADYYMEYSDAALAIETSLGQPLSGRFNILMVESADSMLHETAIEKVKRLIGDNTTVSTYQCYQPATAVWGIKDKSLLLFSVIIGLAVLLISMRSQYAAVVERRHDICIQKAIGWTNSEIALGIVSESVIQALAGGLLGSIFGMIIIMLLPMGKMLGLTTAVSVSIDSVGLAWIWGMGLALAGGTIAGILPALYTARQKPLEGLRRL